MACYEDWPKKQPLLDAARAGDEARMYLILETRRRCEYESWDVESVEVIE